MQCGRFGFVKCSAIADAEPSELELCAQPVERQNREENAHAAQLRILCRGAGIYGGFRDRESLHTPESFVILVTGTSLHVIKLRL